MMLKRMTHLVLIATAAALLGGCPPSISGGGHPHLDRTHRDSVLATGRRLIGLVALIDTYARESGTLPSDLSPVAARIPNAAERTFDLWGRAVRYIARSQRFELRSAGGDGAFDTADDIVVLGRLGRQIPCEVRDEERTFGYDEMAPPCTDSPIPVLALCPALEHADAAEEALSAPVDPILATGRRLVGLARRADWQARRMGGAPPTFRAFVGFREPVDAWERGVRYTPQGLTFELRSAGGDGTFATGDDIVVTAPLGRTIGCEFQAGGETRRCDAPPPPCP